MQWYTRFSPGLMLVSLSCFLLSYILMQFLAIEIRYKLRSYQGILLHIIIAVFAMILTWQQDIRSHRKWFGHIYHNNDPLLIRLSEPLTEKAKSFKCEGIVEAVFQNNIMIPAAGKILIYFSRDSVVSLLNYGDRILLNKPLQRIRNSGNPGAFNYERYAAFQQIFHNVYIKGNEFLLLKHSSINPVRAFIFSSKKYVLAVLQKYLSPDKNILGIAEALLIGYKEDLDKDLVQAYSNTGVVHIIAISGLHLGLIYVMLVWIFDRLPLIKRSRFLKVSLILGSLWFFALLTGASASVLRSAVMFTCIVVGKNFFTQSSIYNSLAASAFILLCYNPFLLWDVGFQLSYMAVIGIVWLQKEIYHIIFIKNRQLDKVWNMAAVTVAAQVITFPVCIYYFHQFPNLFLITNLLAVPLSTVILFAEIILIAFSWIGIAGIYAGKMISLLIWLMNLIIQTCNHFPFSRMDHLNSSVLSTWLMYLVVIGSCCWLMYQNKKMLKVAIIGLLGFVFLQSIIKIDLYRQKKIIIYNVPQHKAIDFVYRNKFLFSGDSILMDDGILQNFHLKPARINLQLDKKEDVLPGLQHKNNYWKFFGKKIIMVDSTVYYEPQVNRLEVDLLIISKNPALRISAITAAIRPSVVVFDASNSLWKIANWKKECLTLALPYFSIPEQGAYVLNIE